MAPLPRWRAALVCLLAAASGSALGACSTVTAAARYSALVTRTVDGDTIVVQYSDGRTDKVRLLGVDTPETHKPGVPVQCFGPEAERFTRAQLRGKTVTLELDRETRDKYRRLLAYVYLDGRRFDDELLRLGFGRLLVIAPNGVHARAMAAAELDARNARRGLWGRC